MQLAIWINRQGVQHCAHLRLGNMYIYVGISQAAGQTGFTHTEKKIVSNGEKFTCATVKWDADSYRRGLKRSIKGALINCTSVFPVSEAKYSREYREYIHNIERIIRAAATSMLFWWKVWTGMDRLPLLMVNVMQRIPFFEP